MVESQPSKLLVAGSSPVSRSKDQPLAFGYRLSACAAADEAVVACRGGKKLRADG